MRQHWHLNLRDMFIGDEPPVRGQVLTPAVSSRIELLPDNPTIVIKISAAYDLPYPFSVSPMLAAAVVCELHAMRPGARILLTEGGVKETAVVSIAKKRGLTGLPHCEFVDAEAGDSVFISNPNPRPFAADGFWLPALWVNADSRILLTTCKLRSHHFQRWYSGATRNLIGLVSRENYRLAASRRNMRSELHQRGMDDMVADLYSTAGRNVISILDARLLARQDEHLPVRFTRRVGAVVVEDDPYDADMQMAAKLKLPFTPPYLDKITGSLLSVPPPSSAPNNYQLTWAGAPVEYSPHPPTPPSAKSALIAPRGGDHSPVNRRRGE